jgi:DNA-binding response OmpR family regulator
MRILVVEDDIQLAEVLTEALSMRQYVADLAKDGEMAWQYLEALEYDLIVLDVTLPKLDGIRLCQRLRATDSNKPAYINSSRPILMLTARDTVTDKIAGLDAGADDYVTKPFDLDELMARIRALLRRGNTNSNNTMSWEKLRLNTSTHEASYEDRLLSLTPKEYALLELLITNGRRILSRSSIVERVWSMDNSPVEETVTSHMRGLRNKLKALGVPEDFIETVHGLGYRLKRL